MSPANGNAVLAASSPSSPASPPETLDWPVLGVEARTLANGLRVRLAAEPTVPLVWLSWVFPAGVECDAAGLSGLATLVPALLREGTATRGAREITRAIDDLGADLVAGCDWDSAFVTLELLSCDLAAGAALLYDLACRASFPAAAMERLRRRRLAEVAYRRRDPRAVADEAFAQALYGDTVYGRPPLGTAGALERMTAADAAAFHAACYRPADSRLVLAGSFDSAEATDLFAAFELPATAATPATAPPSARLASSALVAGGAGVEGVAGVAGGAGDPAGAGAPASAVACGSFAGGARAASSAPASTSAAAAAAFGSPIFTALAPLAPAAPLAKWMEPTAGTTLVDFPGAALTELRVGHAGVSRASEDLPALQVLSAVLGDGPGSRLAASLRQSRGLTYHVQSRFAARHGKGPFLIATRVASEAAGTALAVIRDEIERLRQELVPAVELEQTKLRLLGAELRRWQGVQGLGSALAQGALEGDPNQEFAWRRDRIAAVEPDGLRDLARRHFRPEHLLAVVVGPAATLRSELGAAATAGGAAA